MSAIDDVARRISRNTSSVRVPRAPQTSWHLGTVSSVDNNTNTAVFVHATGVPIAGVPVLLPYTPTAGDVVLLQMHGTSPIIVGRNFVPTNTVSP